MENDKTCKEKFKIVAFLMGLGIKDWEGVGSEADLKKKKGFMNVL